MHQNPTGKMKNYVELQIRMNIFFFVSLCFIREFLVLFRFRLLFSKFSWCRYACFCFASTTQCIE